MANIVSPMNNGVGRFVCQLKRLTLQYCKAGGSSKGMRCAIFRNLGGCIWKVELCDMFRCGLINSCQLHAPSVGTMFMGEGTSRQNLTSIKVRKCQLQ